MLADATPVCRARILCALDVSPSTAKFALDLLLNIKETYISTRIHAARIYWHFYASTVLGKSWACLGTVGTMVCLGAGSNVVSTLTLMLMAWAASK